MVNEGVFRTVMRDTEAEILEKRSTFIAAVKRVSTVEEAETFVKARRKMHPDARHTVFAYLLKDGNKRYGDDSEPQGTLRLRRRQSPCLRCLRVPPRLRR